MIFAIAWHPQNFIDTLVVTMAPTPGATHEFECACKQVKAQVTGEPLYQGWCHCVNCREWNQRSSLSFAVYSWGSVQITQGSDSLAKVSLVNPDLDRLFCKKCGYRVNTESEKHRVKIVSKFNLDGLDFKPVGHSFCKDADKNSLEHFKDDTLPKWLGAPPAFGGPDDQVDL